MYREPVLVHRWRELLAGLERMLERHDAQRSGGVFREFADQRIGRAVAPRAAERGLLLKRAAFRVVSLALYTPMGQVRAPDALKQ